MDDEFASMTEILEVFMWSCNKCGDTSLPLIFSGYEAAEKALSVHWGARHAIRA